MIKSCNLFVTKSFESESKLYYLEEKFLKIAKSLFCIQLISRLPLTGKSRLLSKKEIMRKLNNFNIMLALCL